MRLLSAYTYRTLSRRIVDIISDVNMAYSEHARCYLAECGLPKERTFVTGSPMAEVLRGNLAKIEASDIHARLGLEKGRYMKITNQQRQNLIGIMVLLNLCFIWGNSLLPPHTSNAISDRVTEIIQSVFAVQKEDGEMADT